MGVRSSNPKPVPFPVRVEPKVPQALAAACACLFKLPPAPDNCPKDPLNVEEDRNSCFGSRSLARPISQVQYSERGLEGLRLQAGMVNVAALVECV